jgi:class 3 adenylate cyclase
MGIHMGDVIADEDEVFGDDVNIAVRLEAVAAPGGVAVSAKAYICRNRMSLQRDQSVRRVFPRCAYRKSNLRAVDRESGDAARCWICAD